MIAGVFLFIGTGIASNVKNVDSLSEADPFRIIFFIMVDNKEDGIGSDTINCTHGPFELPQRRRASTLLILARRATLASRK